MAALVSEESEEARSPVSCSALFWRPRLFGKTSSNEMNY